MIIKVKYEGEEHEILVCAHGKRKTSSISQLVANNICRTIIGYTTQKEKKKPKKKQGGSRVTRVKWGSCGFEKLDQMDKEYLNDKDSQRTKGERKKKAAIDLCKARITKIVNFQDWSEFDSIWNDVDSTILLEAVSGKCLQYLLTIFNVKGRSRHNNSTRARIALSELDLDITRGGIERLKTKLVADLLALGEEYIPNDALDSSFVDASFNKGNSFTSNIDDSDADASARLFNVDDKTSDAGDNSYEGDSETTAGEASISGDSDDNDDGNDRSGRKSVVSFQPMPSIRTISPRLKTRNERDRNKYNSWIGRRVNRDLSLDDAVYADICMEGIINDVRQDDDGDWLFVITYEGVLDEDGNDDWEDVYLSTFALTCSFVDEKENNDKAEEEQQQQQQHKTNHKTSSIDDRQILEEGDRKVTNDIGLRLPLSPIAKKTDNDHDSLVLSDEDTGLEKLRTLLQQPQQKQREGICNQQLTDSMHDESLSTNKKTLSRNNSNNNTCTSTLNRSTTVAAAAPPLPPRATRQTCKLNQVPVPSVASQLSFIGKRRDDGDDDDSVLSDDDDDNAGRRQRKKKVRNQQRMIMQDILQSQVQCEGTYNEQRTDSSDEESFPIGDKRQRKLSKKSKRSTPTFVPEETEQSPPKKRGNTKKQQGRLKSTKITITRTSNRSSIVAEASAPSLTVAPKSKRSWSTTLRTAEDKYPLTKRCNNNDKQPYKLTSSKSRSNSDDDDDDSDDSSDDDRIYDSPDKAPPKIKLNVGDEIEFYHEMARHGDSSSLKSSFVGGIRPDEKFILNLTSGNFLYRDHLIRILPDGHFRSIDTFTLEKSGEQEWIGGQMRDTTERFKKVRAAIDNKIEIYWSNVPGQEIGDDVDKENESPTIIHDQIDHQKAQNIDKPILRRSNRRRK